MDALATLERVRAAVPVAELANFHSIGLVDEYVRFLTLKVLRRDFDALPPELSPSHLVDTVWHSHMLLPQEYIRTCESLLPKASASRRNSVKVFKHSPGPRTDHTRYERTLALYEEVFGVAPNPNLWPDEAPERRTPPARPQSAVSSSGPERSPTGWFKIHVKTFAGEELSLNVRAGMSVDGVKQQIQDRAGIPPDQQCLIFAGRQVEDGRTLGFYNVSEGTMLHLVERLRGC